MTFRLLLAGAGIAVAALSLTASANNPAKAGSHVQQAATRDTLSLPAPTFPAVIRIINDPSRALDALDRAVAGQQEAPVEAFVLRAHLLSDLHRYQESVALWDEIARRDRDLDAFASRSAIADLLAARDVEHAAPRIQSIVGPLPANIVRSPKSGVRSRKSTPKAGPRTPDNRDLLLLGLADAYQAAGQPDRASAIYRGVLARERQNALADRARLGLAAAEESAGRLDTALATWHEATITWRLADTFTTARAEERRLAAHMRREVTPLSPQEYLTIAARLSAASHLDEAVALLERGMEQHRLAASDRVEAAIIDNLYRGRRNDAAVSRAARFLKQFAGSPLSPSVRLLQLRLDIRLGNLAAARARLDSLLADRAVPLTARQSAERLVAAALAATGAPLDGLAIYRRLLRERLTRTDRFDLCWRAGIAAIRAGDDRAAIDLLRQSRKYARARSTPRSTLYWLAAALERSGDSAEARRTWTQLVSENACDYYGLRAAERLHLAPLAGQPTERPSVSQRTGGVSFLAVSDSASASPEFDTAMILARAGLLDDAASAFHAAMARFRGDTGLALLAARAATAAGDYATAASIVSTRFGASLAHPGSGPSDDVWRMAFPRAYWPEVEAAATKSQVDPLLLLALMRRESRFVATARSRTGALGLFQIMPSTAREIVSASDEATEGDTVLDAPVSADLAARLVKRIATRFGGATAPVVAAYNAGEDRVEDWWRASTGVAEDLFVDSIPYGETRQYVREVLANYATYKRLYGAH